MINIILNVLISFADAYLKSTQIPHLQDKTGVIAIDI